MARLRLVPRPPPTHHSSSPNLNRSTWIIIIFSLLAFFFINRDTPQFDAAAVSSSSSGSNNNNNSNSHATHRASPSNQQQTQKAELKEAVTTTTTTSSVSSRENDEDNSAMIPINNNNNNKTFTVFCYGDSLTAGMTSGTSTLTPYAPFLQAALRKNKKLVDHTIQVNVFHVGLSGWTTRQFVEVLDDPDRGLVGNLRKYQEQQQQHQQQPIDLMILLGGTNDLGHRYPVEEIQANLIALHEAVLKNGHAKETLALGIPGSRWQSGDPNIVEQVQQIHQGLQARASPTTSFLPFPFAYDETDGNWARDGLHMTPKGYQTLGEALADWIANRWEQRQQRRKK